MLNFVFLFIYAFLADFLGAKFTLIIYTFHAVLLLLPYLRQRKIIITPLFLFIINVLIINIANIFLVGIVGTARNQLYKYIVPQYVGLAVQIWCISSTFTIIGFQLARNRTLAAVDFEIKNTKFLSNIVYGLLIIDFLQIYGIRILTVSQIFKLVNIGNLIGILFFARLWAKTNKSQYFVYCIALFLMQTYIGLFSYLRINVILPSVVLALGYFIGKEDVKYLFTYRIVPFMFIFGLYISAFGRLSHTRSNFFYAFVSDNNNEEMLARKGFNYNNETKNDNTGGSLLDRSANLAQLTCVINLVKLKGFYNGRASEPLIIALVPRFLWPDKPAIALGKWFALEIGVGYSNAEGLVNNSVNMTIPGELYLDFGWIGVILGSLFVGYLFAILWNSSKFYNSEYNIGGILYGGYLLVISFEGFGVDLQIVITVLSVFFTFLIVKRLPKLK